MVKFYTLFTTYVLVKSKQDHPPGAAPRHLTATEAQIVGNLIEQKPK